MADPKETQRILLIGLEPLVKLEISTQFPGASNEEIMTGEQFFATFEIWKDGDFLAIFSGAAVANVETSEIAQVLNAQCPNTPKVYVTARAEDFSRKKLIKNGFEFAFFLPADSHQLKLCIQQKILSSDRKVYKTVRIQDFGAQSSLAFDTFVFLPLNKRYVHYSSAGRPMSEEKLSKLQRHKIQIVHIDQADTQKFYQYAASQLAAIGASTAISETERQEKLGESVRILFSDIFDQSTKSEFDTGKEMMDTCQGIISNYITGGKSGDWYEKIMAKVGESNDVYDHATNVSTFASLFGIGLGVTNPEDLALAGLFHDIGLSQLPAELSGLAPEDVPSDKAEIYYTHPELSVAILKNRKIIITAEVEKAILQHHESYNGRGFPKALGAARLTETAQILRFADEFDYLTRIEEGKPRRDAAEAVKIIRSKGTVGPDLVTRIEKVLLPQKP